MRVNIYAEELPELTDLRPIAGVETVADTGQKFHGARLFLKSASELHDTPDDDDRSAVTIWGPPGKVAKLLRGMADHIETYKETGQ